MIPVNYRSTAAAAAAWWWSSDDGGIVVMVWYWWLISIRALIWLQRNLRWFLPRIKLTKVVPKTVENGAKWVAWNVNVSVAMSSVCVSSQVMGKPNQISKLSNLKPFFFQITNSVTHKRKIKLKRVMIWVIYHLGPTLLFDYDCFNSYINHCLNKTSNKSLFNSSTCEVWTAL